MRIAILSRGDGWHVQDLIRAATQLGHDAQAVDFRSVMACDDRPLSLFDAAIIRTMPAGSLEQIVFRMDLMHALAASGRAVLNPPRAIEVCVDKYLTNVRLASANIRVPRTAVCQLANQALDLFERLGRDVVVKPLFGAEGRGMVRVNDHEMAWRVFHAIEQTRGVMYIQEFVDHPGWDLRVFVLNHRVLAAMKRTNHGDWRTNVAQGGTAEPFALPPDLAQLAIRASEATGTIVSGVDLLVDSSGDWYVIEVNAVPGWKALAPTSGIDVASAVVRHLVEMSRTG